MYEKQILVWADFTPILIFLNHNGTMCVYSLVVGSLVYPMILQRLQHCLQAQSVLLPSQYVSDELCPGKKKTVTRTRSTCNQETRKSKQHLKTIQTPAKDLVAAALDTPDIVSWFLLFLQHCVLAGVVPAECHQAKQLPVALVGKSPSRGR